MARRRRDLSRSSRYFRRLLLVSFLLSCFFSLNLPKNPNLASSSMFFFPDRQFCIGVREQCFKISLNQTSPTNLSQNRTTEGLLLPVYRDDAADQIWGLYRSGKQIQPDSASRDDVTAQIRGFYRSGKQTTPDLALRPSSRHKRRQLCNGVREQCFLISLNQTSPTNLSLNSEPPSPAHRPMPSTLTPANPLTLPSTRTPASTPRFSLPSTSIPASTSHPGRPSTLTPANTQHLGDGAVIATDPYTCGGAAKSVSKKATLGFSFLGLSLNFGPLILLWPKTSNFSPATLLSRPRAIFTAIATVTKRFRDLSFSFFPRSQNTIIDDLAKKAARSMTIGPPISMYFSVSF